MSVEFYNKNAEEFYNLSAEDFTTVDNPPLVDNQYITYSFYYWTSSIAKTNGNAPYILANPVDMDMDFTFSPDATYDGLTLEQKCEKHLQDVILPTLV